MDRTFPDWPKEKRLTKVNVRDNRYLDILLDVLMVVMGGKYTEVDDNYVYKMYKSINSLLPLLGVGCTYVAVLLWLCHNSWQLY